MRYLTHQFAHSETLDRARRWLVDAGISRDRIHVHRHGVPSLTVEVEPGEVDGIEMVIRAAENNDPDGLPSFWELARLHPTEAPHGHEEIASLTAPEALPSFLLAWHPVDTNWDEDTRREIELQQDFRRMRP
jgi:hypothetical protein